MFSPSSSTIEVELWKQLGVMNIKCWFVLALSSGCHWDFVMERGQQQIVYKFTHSRSKPSSEFINKKEQKFIVNLWQTKNLRLWFVCELWSVRMGPIAKEIACIVNADDGMLLRLVSPVSSPLFILTAICNRWRNISGSENNNWASHSRSLSPVRRTILLLVHCRRALAWPSSRSRNWAAAGR